jgi:DNA-directed RNA polymerases I, II, and III subunit RPABC2
MGDEEGDDFEAEYAEEAEEEIEPTEAEANELADLKKLVKQHNEIWMEYKETIDKGIVLSGPDDPRHTTAPFLSQYEKTKLLSLRARQLNDGANAYIVVPEGVTSSFEIAELELRQKKLPFILKRPLPDGTYEYWRLLDLVILE